jgi:hypothetical protein
MLNDEPVAEAPVAEAAPETELPADDQPRGPDGKFLSKQTGVEPGETPEAVPPTELPKEEYGVVRAVRDENKGLKQQLEALQQQVQSLQQPKEPPAPPPSVWDDDQAYGQHLIGQATSAASFNANLNTSEMLCRDRFDDFDDMKAKFLEMAQANPTVAQQALADPHPWRKAYQIAQNAAKMEALGAVDLTDLEAKIEARVREEMMGQTPVPPAPAALPLSLTGERNVGSRSGPAWGGPPTLSEMLR